MKKEILTLTACVLLISINAFGQQSVPSVVKNHFETAYVQATEVEWELEGNLYRVEFETENDVDREIWYDSNSTIVREETEIPVNDLPQAVRQAAERGFPGYEIDDVEKVTQPQGVTYRVELEALLKRDWDVVYSPDGKILEKK
jgi:hypothetical protein